MEPCIKTIANYPPQFQCIPENDFCWGEGFTDWETEKNAASAQLLSDALINNGYYCLTGRRSAVGWISRRDT